MERREPSYTVSGKVNEHIHSGEQYGGSVKHSTTKCQVTQPSHTWVWILRNQVFKRYCVPTIMATPGTISKIQKKPECRRSGEGVKKMGHAYPRQGYPAIKRMKECHLQPQREER